MCKDLVERVKKALQQDNSIAVDISEVGNYEGFSTEHFEALGLTRADLKKLVKSGLALHGYSKNIWVEGEKPPGRAIIEKGKMFVSTGSKSRWILVGSKEEANAGADKLQQVP